jgi:transposase
MQGNPSRRRFSEVSSGALPAAQEPDVHVVLDNSSTHETPEVLCWREAHPTVHFHFTPTGTSWLNMVEAWFSMLTRRSVRRGSFDTVKVLARHIRNYIEHFRVDQGSGGNH